LFGWLKTTKKNAPIFGFFCLFG
jgi:hypothetical protein